MPLFDLLIGLGIFLFGMSQLEKGIEALSGQWIKRWLAKSTQHPIGSVASGTVITALLQSSSMVGLIMLAFASAGIIPLYNAIGVLLGANLGTTLTGWIVTTLGFKLELTVIALPAIGFGCLIQVFGDTKPKLRHSGVLLFGFGLLLFGLGLMKESVVDLPRQLDLNLLKDLNAFSFLLIGTLLTAIIQSSSATMMIALTALHSGIIDLPNAAALIIGADLGTTSTTMLGSIKGSLIKRQLAFSHLLFNLVVDSLAFVFLLPVLPALLLWLNLQDPLYGLVAFHSLFNVLGLFIFVPILKPYSDWIGQRFTAKQSLADSLLNVPTQVPEAAISACTQHVQKLLTSALTLNLSNLNISVTQLPLTQALQDILAAQSQEAGFEQRYEQLKKSEGELLHYVMQLQQQPLKDSESGQLMDLLSCTRDTVYAVKAMKDIRSNLMEMRDSDSLAITDFLNQYVEELKPFYQNLLELILQQHDSEYREEQLLQLGQMNEQLHQIMHQKIQQCSHVGAIEPEQLSTLFNVNREISRCGINLLKAVQHSHTP